MSASPKESFLSGICPCTLLQQTGKNQICSSNMLERAFVVMNSSSVAPVGAVKLLPHSGRNRVQPA